MSLFPGGRAAVFGIPEPFDLLSELISAKTIRLATAFALQSGWDLISPSVEKCEAETFLLAGKDFFLTEPYVLRAWLKLSGNPHMHAALHMEKGVTFHPKVLIVESQNTFAIVGSGNLSAGGLRDNVECGFFLASAPEIKQLIRWFDNLFNASTRLNEVLILDYEKMWNSIRHQREELENLQKELDKKLTTEKNFAIWKNWNDAVAAARSYQLSADFPRAYEGRVKGVKQIRESLRSETGFAFDLEDWKKFYSVLALGRLIPIDRDKIFKQKDKLQSGLRALVAPNANVSEVLNDFLSPKGQYRILGLGLNTLSKILAVLDPQKWTVFNTPVEYTLKQFGYVPRRGASVAQKFEAFCQSMEQFKAATGLKDALALDAFFFNFSRQKLGIAEDLL